MATKKVILFVEGSPDTTNGILRKGFEKLLEKQLGKNKPKIIPSEGKSQAIKKFLKNQLACDFALLLIDLDKPESELNNDLIENHLETKRENVFYMVQEMENWFLSQPDKLDQFYGVDNNGKKISDKIPKKKAIDFSEPDKVLEELSKNTKRGKYHKIRHGVELLQFLDADRLEKDFTEFARLITRLKS